MKERYTRREFGRYVTAALGAIATVPLAGCERFAPQEDPLQNIRVHDDEIASTFTQVVTAFTFTKDASGSVNRMFVFVSDALYISETDQQTGILSQFRRERSPSLKIKTALAASSTPEGDGIVILAQPFRSEKPTTVNVYRSLDQKGTYLQLPEDVSWAKSIQPISGSRKFLLYGLATMQNGTKKPRIALYDFDDHAIPFATDITDIQGSNPLSNAESVKPHAAYFDPRINHALIVVLGNSSSSLAINGYFRLITDISENNHQNAQNLFTQSGALQAMFVEQAEDGKTLVYAVSNIQQNIQVLDDTI